MSVFWPLVILATAAWLVWRSGIMLGVGTGVLCILIAYNVVLLPDVLITLHPDRYAATHLIEDPSLEAWNQVLQFFGLPQAGEEQ